MTKEAKSQDSTDLVSIQDEIKQQLANVDKTTNAPRSARISVKGGVFTLPGGETNAGPIHAVVVDSIRQNNYYKSAYNPNEMAPPECYAIGKNIDELRPSPNCSEPQFDGLCKDCPMNQFGSAMNGGRGKACTNNLNLALLPKDFTKDSELLMLRVMPTALNSWDTMVRDLAANKGMVPIQTITSIGFKPGVAYPTLTFSTDSALDPDKLSSLAPHLQKAKVILNNEPSSD